MPLKLGYDPRFGTEISTDFLVNGHTLLVGGTGSGKSIASQYILFNLLKYKNIYPIKLFVCDFKRSGDYKDLSNHFAEAEKVTDLIIEFYELFEKTSESNNEIQLLIIDEYQGYLNHLAQVDKRLYESIKLKISNILCLGRSRRTFIFIIVQRLSASFFPSASGAADNFQNILTLGNLTIDSRRTVLGGEHMEDMVFEESYHPGKGEGFVLIDGKALQPIKIPYIANVDKLKATLRQLAKA